MEAEVRALWVAADGVWPDAGTDAAEYPKLTIVLGSKWRFLDAKFATAASGAVADALAQARLAYNDRLNRIPKIAAGTQVVEIAASTGPLVATVDDQPGLSFGEFTVRHDPLNRFPHVWRPWGW